MAKVKPGKQYSKDPIYNWLVFEITTVFTFLVDKYSFELKSIDASSRGCSITYIRGKVRIQVWAEMGSRPEVDIVLDGKRKSLNWLIAKRWPNNKLPDRPGDADVPTEKKHFNKVLESYAVVIKEHFDDIVSI